MKPGHRLCAAHPLGGRIIVVARCSALLCLFRLIPANGVNLSRFVGLLFIDSVLDSEEDHATDIAVQLEVFEPVHQYLELASFIRRHSAPVHC